MKIYNYSRDTGEFIGESEARENPLEEGKFILPANSTFEKAPKATTTKTPVFKDGKWSLLVDNRGVEVDVLGEIKTITDIGTVEDDLKPTDEALQEYNEGVAKAHIKRYRDISALNFDYKNITMRLTDGARTDLTAVYSVVVINTAIPDETVMMNWQEPDFDDLLITAGDLRADGISFMQHRQKCFTASSMVSAQFEALPMATIEEIEEAFDLAYNNL